MVEFEDMFAGIVAMDSEEFPHDSEVMAGSVDAGFACSGDTSWGDRLLIDLLLKD
jgi:hypothetical protein